MRCRGILLVRWRPSGPIALFVQKEGRSVKSEIQKAGELPNIIEPGMQLVLGDLGCVVTVVALHGELVVTSGSGEREAAVFNIEPDGTMTLAQARECQLACDWDCSWHRADFYACADEDEELAHTSPEQALVARFTRKPWRLDLAAWVELVCPLEIKAYECASSSAGLYAAGLTWDEARICFAVATRQYDAETVLNILRSRWEAFAAPHTTAKTLSL